MRHQADGGIGAPTAIIVAVVSSTGQVEPTLPCIFCRYDFAAKDDADFRHVELSSLQQVERDTNTAIPKKNLRRGDNGSGSALMKCSLAWIQFRVASSNGSTERHIAQLPDRRRQRVELDCALVTLVHQRPAADVLATLERRCAVTNPTLAALIESLEYLSMTINEVETLDPNERHQFLCRQVSASTDNETIRKHRCREFGESLHLVLLARALGCELHSDSLARVFPFDEVVLPGSFAAELLREARASETRVADRAGTNIYLPSHDYADAVSEPCASPANVDTATHPTSDPWAQLLVPTRGQPR
jgi:hypothetical protein